MPARKKAKKTTKKTTKKKTEKRSRPSGRERPDTARKSLKAVAVGDVVRFAGNLHNLMSRYDANVARDSRGAEAVEGIVCSIRNIATGKLAAKTRGDISGYVLEIIHHQTFRLHYASDRNTGGPRGPEDVRNNPTWARLRELLSEMAAKKEYISTALGGLAQEPLRPLLDGWRVVKVKAEHVQSAA